jgi:hypothetical protein
VTAEPEPTTPEPEVGGRQPAAPAEASAIQPEDTAPKAQPPAREPTLVYEMNAEEYFPADVELEEEHPEGPETRQLRAPDAPERVDSTPLPYEGTAKEQGPASSESTDVVDSPTGSKEAEPCPQIEEQKLKSADRSESAQLTLPRMD